MTDHHPIGFWLRLVDRLLDEQFAATLEEHGVTRRQWQLLGVLSQGAASLAELDAAIAPFLRAATDEAAAESSSEQVTELVDSHWVTGTPESYSLTERGDTAFHRLAGVVADNRTQVARGVTDAEYMATVDVLQRVAHNLGWNDPSESKSV
ncbi:MAG: MarR family transcriptional regulator [Microbacteriaceae bacterium]